MLRIREIDVFYDGLQALYSPSLEIREQEFVCILGPNGAGKSTLLQTVAGMMMPKAGEIIFYGKNINGFPPHEVTARGIALIPEEGWLFPQMPVEENLLMGAFIKRTRKKSQVELQFVYELFPRLKERRRQKAETLSGGERQMLCVGRGLMSQPKLLMLDEPSLGLAPMIIEDIFQTLRRINHDEKKTILLTEQNIFNALNASKRGYVMENGRIVLEGTSLELLNNNHVRKNYMGI
jgi:branched-chain amino acid transport system ATP-binding protein